MKKTLIVLGCLSLGLAHAQQVETVRGQINEETLASRVGVNTEKPVATLEVAKLTTPQPNQVEGFMLPHLTQEQRNNMKQAELVNGLQIFNIDKNCIDWWNGSTWQCTDGSLQDNHGDGFTPPKTVTETYSEAITVYKNDCPAGQQATANAFRTFTKGQISGTGTGVGRTQAIAYDEAIKKAKKDFYQKTQEAVNNQFAGTQYCQVQPNAKPTLIPNIPENIEIGDGVHWWSSIYDNDYLNADGTLSRPTGLASTERTAAKGHTGADEPIIDRQGTISTSGVNIEIPVKLTAGTGAYLSPWSHEIEIPAEYTEDGRKGIVRMNWNGTNVTSTSTSLSVRIAAIGSEIKLKKLDLVNGQGADLMGLLMNTFRFPKTKTEMADENLWSGKFELRLISGIPDKHFTEDSVIDRNGTKRQIHRHVYTPKMYKDGTIWLETYIGDRTTDTRVWANNSYQVVNGYSWVGMQWGRKADGHEYKITSCGYGSCYDSVLSGPIRAEINNFYDNCPEGFKTPTERRPVPGNAPINSITEGDFRTNQHSRPTGSIINHGMEERADAYQKNYCWSDPTNGGGYYSGCSYTNQSGITGSASEQNHFGPYDRGSIYCISNR